jgi:hypothetical protein
MIRTFLQDLYAIEEDDLYNKRLVWTGTQWMDESSGKVVKLAAAHPQQTQELLLLQVRCLLVQHRGVGTHSCVCVCVFCVWV